MNHEGYRKAIFTLVFFIVIAISFMIIKPFLTAVLTGIIFSYIFYPIYSTILKKISNKNISSMIASALVVIILTLPLFFVLNTVSQEARTIYLLSRQKAVSGQFLDPCEPADKPVCRYLNYFVDMANDPKVRYYFDTTTKSATAKITDSISNILFSIPIFMLNMFVSLFVMFFLFRDGKILIDKIKKIMPLKSKYKQHVIQKLNEMTSAVIYGSLIIAIIQGMLGGIGFWVVGLPSPLIWAIVMIFAALIPYIGSSIIWFPAALILIFSGYVDSEPILIIKGAGLILYGTFIIGLIDNILKPKIIGDKGGLHPVLVLLGVIGGLNLLGFIGIIIGPIILAMLVTFIKIYEEEKR